MPYRKVGKDDYVSPNGTHINGAQNRLWHANGDKWPGEKKSESSMDKFSSKPKAASYAAGGPVIGKYSNFMKVKDEFRDPDEGNASADEDQNYAKSGEGAGKGFIKPPKNTRKVLK